MKEVFLGYDGDCISTDNSKINHYNKTCRAADGDGWLLDVLVAPCSPPSREIMSPSSQLPGALQDVNIELTSLSYSLERL